MSALSEEPGKMIEHPHPVPPLDFIAASRAQHALTPAGAGPPQQLPGCVVRDSSEVVVF
jgi:hypothetical protein